jgi:hypothetical protein
MSPEAQQIAIAEACGWTPSSDPKQNPKAWWCPPNATTEIKHRGCNGLPNYPIDLNAMHEAFDEIRKRGLVQEYGHELVAVTTVDRGAYFAHATAAQRAEAFLRTIGKWEDDK